MFANRFYRMLVNHAYGLVVVFLTVVTMSACSSDKVVGVAPVNADSIAKAKSDSIALAATMSAKYVAVVSTDGGQNYVYAIAGKVSSMFDNRGNPFGLTSPNSMNSAVITNLTYGQPFIVGAAASFNLFATSFTVKAGYRTDYKVGGLTNESAVSFHNEGMWDYNFEYFFADSVYVKYSPSNNRFQDDFNLAAPTRGLASRLSFAVGEVFSCRGAGSGYLLLQSDGISVEARYQEGTSGSMRLVAPTMYRIECYRLDQAPTNVKAAIMAGKSLLATD